MALISDFIQANKITDLAVALIQRKTVYASIADVRNNWQGSSAQIPILNSGQVNDYVAGQDMSVNNVGATHITIPVDQSKYINDYMDDIDDAISAQSALPQLLNTLTNNMANIVDRFALNKFYFDGTLNNAVLGTEASPVAITQQNVSEFIANANMLLTKADAPEFGRFIVLPPEITTALSLANLLETSNSDEATRRKGYKGSYLGIEIFESNNLPDNSNYPSIPVGAVGIVFGVKGAGSVLFNYDKFRAVPAEDRFGQKYQAVSQYGAGGVTKDWLGFGVVDLS